MDYKEKMGRAKKLFADVRAILENEDATPEEKASTKAMLKEAQELKEEAIQLKDILASADEMLPHLEKEQGEDEQKQEREDKTEFKDWNEFLYWAHRANHAKPQYQKLDPRLQWFEDEAESGKRKERESKDMVESVGASGGFLVPAEFLPQLQGVMAEDTIVRRRATIIRMRRRQINVPVLDQTTTTAGQAHWFGGMVFLWTEEATEKTEDDFAFRQVQLVAHKLIGYTRASDELVGDSAISIGDFISGPLGFAGGVAWYEDYAMLRGTGAGQPLGIINAGATITVARQAVGTPIQYVDLVNMLENFLPSGRGEWAFNQTALSNLLALQDPEGHYVFQPNAREGVPQTLFGYPVKFTEKLPTVGNAGDVLLADYRYYLVGDRQATTIDSTQFDRWRYDETSWRVVHRVDGQPWLSAPLTLQDGTAQVSPFVILGAKTT